MGGGSSLQVKCKEVTFVSFMNYGANSGLKALSDRVSKTPDTLKCSDFTYAQVKDLFWPATGTQQTPSPAAGKGNAFVDLGLLNHKYGWNSGFKTEILEGKQAFRLVSGFKFELVKGKKLTEALLA